ncbi:unnamed protein product [Bathycoccus prasinos]
MSKKRRFEVEASTAKRVHSKPDKLWRIVLDYPDIFDNFILPKLSCNDVKFFYDCNSESRMAIKQAVRRTDGATGTSSAYQSWYVSAATNNGWVEMSMDNSVFETAGNPAYYPTQFREITGNTVSSNRYRVFRGNDEIGKYLMASAYTPKTKVLQQ